MQKVSWDTTMFVDRPLPEGLELSPLRGKRLANLTLRGEGRAPGVPNKITKDLKEGVLTAAANIGRDGNGEGGLVGFLEDLALHHKKAFTSLLVKVLPMTGGYDGTPKPTIALNVVSIESGNYLSIADCERL